MRLFPKGTRRSDRSAFALLALIPLSACIDDPTAISGDPLPLSEAEAQILGVTVWRDIMLQQQDALANANNVESLIEFVARSDDRRVDQRLVLIEDCDFGGEREFHGLVRGEADASGDGFVEVQIVQKWEDCRWVEKDQRLVLSGDPDVDARVRYDFTPEGDLDVEGVS
jgi:hypothetical protein